MNRFRRSNYIPLQISCSDTSSCTDTKPSNGNAVRVNQLDTSLISAIVREDRGAMAQLYDIYYPRLHRFLAGMIHDRELVPELINDVMMVVWQKAASFRRQSMVSTWIFGIAYRRALDGIRKDKRYREILDLVPYQPNADSSLRESIADRDLNKFMAVLTPEQLEASIASVAANDGDE